MSGFDFDREFRQLAHDVGPQANGPAVEELMRIAHRRQVARVTTVSVAAATVLAVSAGLLWATQSNPNHQVEPVAPPSVSATTNPSTPSSSPSVSASGTTSRDNTQQPAGDELVGKGPLLPRMLRAGDLPALPRMDNNWWRSSGWEGPPSDNPGDDYTCQALWDFKGIQEAHAGFLSAKGGPSPRRASAGQLMIRLDSEAKARDWQGRFAADLAKCEYDPSFKPTRTSVRGVTVWNYVSDLGNNEFATSDLLVLRERNLVTVVTVGHDGKTPTYNRATVIGQLIDRARNRMNS